MCSSYQLNKLSKRPRGNSKQEQSFLYPTNATNTSYSHTQPT